MWNLCSAHARSYSQQIANGGAAANHIYCHTAPIGRAHSPHLLETIAHHHKFWALGFALPQARQLPAIGSEEAHFLV